MRICSCNCDCTKGCILVWLLHICSEYIQLCKSILQILHSLFASPWVIHVGCYMLFGLSCFHPCMLGDGMLGWGSNPDPHTAAWYVIKNGISSWKNLFQITRVLEIWFQARIITCLVRWSSGIQHTGLNGYVFEWVEEKWKKCCLNLWIHFNKCFIAFLLTCILGGRCSILASQGMEKWQCLASCFSYCLWQHIHADAVVLSKVKDYVYEAELGF